MKLVPLGLHVTDALTVTGKDPFSSFTGVQSLVQVKSHLVPLQVFSLDNSSQVQPRGDLPQVPPTGQVSDAGAR
ncbi:hypothetical protein E2C01_062391 [Portunus trituberculatus]|uniref:Uncharacterized protein n=1 Tax=Portunus trituberculatus TaxID=210409 RepID=A0A5B7HHW3_PORTR|nr:hypothetical protein [Portunus trituberculatus]